MWASARCVGNFDDAQTGVKKLFSDEALREELASRGYFLSSANSINWGRVLPQIVYYISAYCDLLRDGRDPARGRRSTSASPPATSATFWPPTTHREMGVPIGRLICASNSNNVLTDFIAHRRAMTATAPFYNTASPSMDILISIATWSGCCCLLSQDRRAGAAAT